MARTLRLEELAQLMAVLALLVDLHAAWWWYPVLLLAPDIGMLGYLRGPRVGAFTYNMLHHKGIALLVAGAGVLAVSGPWVFVGLAMYGHASMDRVFGFGLKHADGFRHTHLGWIGGGRTGV